jgi:hypothetical protein
MTAKQPKSKPCKTKTCNGTVAPPGISFCATCRAKMRARKKSWLRRNPEAKRGYNRHAAARYRRSRKPAAVAYRERSRPKTRAATRAWIAAHPEERARAAALRKAIAAGEVKRPSACDHCHQSCKTVAFRNATGKVTNWYCWSHWWAARRGETLVKGRSQTRPIPTRPTASPTGRKARN